MQGGTVETVLQLVETTPLTPVIINPDSKFVVITYWWGTGNLNKNLQRPCPEEIVEPIREAMEEELVEDDPDYAEIYQRVFKIDKIRKEKRARTEALTEEEKTELKEAFSKQLAYLTPYFARQNVRAQLNERYNQAVEKLRSEGKFKQPVTFDEMITTWKQTCEAQNCNYLVVEYPIGREDYQNGINAKPAFIRKALDACPGRGVLYIDGDMYINKYPAIFDMKNVDYMARGWNVDPRASAKYKTDVCFDPYIFETSGGTMYFAPTRQAVLLLKQWAKVSAEPDMQGKADDRILSMVFTTGRQNEAISSIQLPIEYLWLNDAYDFQKKEDIIEDRIYIEHPACLTAEETAREQGASASREPPKYEEIVTDMIDCAQPGGVFYEYVFFTERRFVESFEPYLNYLRRAKNNKGEPFYKIVDFDQHYGRYNKVAYKNMEKSNAIDVSTLPPTETLAKLPQDTTVPMIIACFKNGNDVLIGDFKGTYSATYDIMAENVGDQHLSPYQRKIKIDTKKPIYMSGMNPVLIHLLMMCDTLEDMNQHYHESFLFASRIRAWWTKTDRI